MLLIHEKGYTLIELIIIIALISILSVSIASNFSIIERYKLKSQAEKLASDLRRVQKLAISNNSSYYFKIFKKEKGYLIERIGDSKNNNFIPIMEGIGFGEESKINIKYTSKGIPSNSDDGTIGAGGTIYLVGNSYKIRITIRPVTGRVVVYNITKKNINGDVENGREKFGNS